MAHVYIPAQLRELTGGVGDVELDAATLGEAIDALDAQFPGIRERLCRGDTIAPTLQVDVDGSITSRGFRTRLSAESEVHFLPAIGGG